MGAYAGPSGAITSCAIRSASIPSSAQRHQIGQHNALAAADAAGQADDKGFVGFARRYHCGHRSSIVQSRFTQIGHLEQMVQQPDLQRLVTMNRY